MTITLITSCATIKIPIDIKLDPQARIGVKIVSIKTGRTIFERGASELFMPGSSLKIVTAASALYHLGPSYRFETPILADGVTQHAIHNLYVKGNGDPSLSDYDLEKIARVLRQYGIKTVRGDIVIDNTAFDDILHGKGWMWDDMHRGFSAPTDALNVDFNRIAVVVRPGSKEGDPARVTTEPDTRYVKIHKRAITRAGNSLRFHSTSEPGNSLTLHDAIDVDGNVPKGTTYQYKTYAVKDPSLFAGHVLLERLRGQGVHFKGKVRKGEVPANAELLDTLTSRTLSESLFEWMKVSNNQASEALLKTIGLKMAGAPASFEAGIQATEQFLREKVLLNTNAMKHADGSGLSRYSLMSPSDFVAILMYMWPNFDLGPSFVASLPLKDHVRAKSGTMTGVCSLAGYLEGESGDVLAFAIMINGAAMERSKCHQQFGKILTAARQSAN
jgi:D-alanyl-D-alanine carboxypeptidase/D-alanyl-D-alanine-endopeptidase (penicillin-binding protein 4)